MHKLPGLLSSCPNRSMLSAIHHSYLFVDAEDPALDVWIVIMRDVIDGENRTVLH